MIVFFCLNERMIVHDSFSVSMGNQGGLNAMATALPSSCEEQQSNNLDEYMYSDKSDAESEKVRKAKKSKKPGNEKWSGSLICNLIHENEAQPCLWKIFCDDYHNRDVTGNNTALQFNVREGITSVSKKILRSDASTLRNSDILS